MKFKRIMLMAIVLLAILTIGAVSASDDADFNETLTVDDVEDVSLDAPLDENDVSDGGELIAASESDDVISDGNSTSGTDTKLNPGMNVNVEDTEYGEPVEVEITFDNLESGEVTACLDNATNYPVNIVDKCGQLSLLDLEVGDHVLNVYYPGDDTYDQARLLVDFSILPAGNSTGTGEDINGNDDVSLWVNTGIDLRTSHDNLGEIFAAVTVSEGTEGNVTFSIDEYAFYNTALSDFDPGRIEGNIYNIALEKDGIFIFEGLNSEDVVTFAFLDENGDEISSRDYRIFFGDDTIRFEETDDGNGEDNQIDVGLWDENDERGTLYIDSEGDVLSIYAPRDYEGVIFRIYVNDNEAVSWEAEFDGDNQWEYRAWGLEDLGISEAGDYNIVVESDNGEGCDILLNRTIAVSQFNEDSFRAMILYAREVIKFYTPENGEGTIRINTVKEIGDDDYDEVFDETYEITDEYRGNWKEFALADIGFEADGAFRIFTITVTNTADEEVYRYRISYVDGEREPEGDDWYEEKIEFAFNAPDEEPIEFNKTSDVLVAWLYIPNGEEHEDYADVSATVYVRLNGEIIKTVRTSDFTEPLERPNHYPIILDLSYLNDKDLLSFRVEAIHKDTGESAINEEENEWLVIVEDKGDYVIFHDDVDLERLEFSVFAGNLTLGTTNDPDLMGVIRDNLVIITISNALGITEGTITVSDGESTVFTRQLSECEREYDYGSDGYTYYLSLDDVKDILPEGTNLTVAFSYADNTLAQKRIRFEDYLYSMVTVEDIEKQYRFEIQDDLMLHENDTAIHIYSDTNRQAIYFDLGGGYFTVYVNGVKVENLGRVSYNTWMNKEYWRDDDEDYTERFAYDEEAFLEYVAGYWGSELELFRLTSWNQGAPEIEITLEDLGITESGTYNIRITHYPSVPGGLDDHSSLGIESMYAEEMQIPAVTEVLNANITCNFDPDYAGANIYPVTLYGNGIPFLFTFDFGDNIISQSNSVLIYVDGELAFNSTILYYDENDEGEMELVKLWIVGPEMLSEDLFDECGYLDVGEYEAVVYLVKGDDAPVEIGRGNFSRIKQRGDMNFTIGSSVEDDGVHTILYADIPEGDWTDYTLEINIADSDKVYPEEGNDLWVYWFNEYVIFKDNQIYFKDSLDKVIGKGPVAIDLGVLDDGTHIFVALEHGEETVFGDWDFYHYCFAVSNSNNQSIGTPEEVQNAVDLYDIVDLSRHQVYDFGESAVIISRDNVVLRGNGNTIIKGYGIGNGLVQVTGSNVTIEGIRFIDTNPNNNFIYDGSVNGVGIRFSGVTGGLVNNCIFTDFASAVIIQRSRGMVIENSVFTGGYTTKLINDPTVNKEMGSKYISVYAQSQEVTVRNNVFNGCALDAISIAQGSGSNIIEGNEFIGVSYGIYLGGTSSVNSVIRNNVFRNCGEFKKDGKFFEGMPFIDIRKASSDIAIEGNTFVAGQNSILIAAEQGNEAYGFPSSMGNINVTGNTVTKSSEDIDGSTIVLFEIVCDDGSSLYPYAPIYVTDNVAASDVMVLNVIYRDSDGNVTAENVMYDEWIVENGYVLTKVSEPLIDCNLTIEVADIFLGEDAVVTVTVPSNATGEITISLNGASYSNTIAGGQSVFNIGDLAVGTYTVIAAYSGDEKYGEAQANKTFNVAEPPKVDPVIEFAIDSVVYPNDLVINVAAPSDATGWVNVTLGNHTYELALAGGKATQSISDLNAGYYAVFAVYSGDDKYNNCSYDLNATVLKAESSIALNNTEFDYSDDIEVGYALVGAHDFTAVVADCPDASVAYEGGVIHISGITAGTHTIQFTTVPDENYNEAVVNVTITVNKVDSTLTVPEVVFNYGESGVSTVTFDGATGVNAVVNDLGAVVDVDGNVITVSGLTAGNYVLTVTTVPDANHNEVTKTANVTVNKVDSAATMDNIEFDYGSSGTTVVTLTGAVNFTASVNDDKAVVSVDGNVIAVSGLDADSYTLTVTTVPDANHNSVSVNATVTVSKVDSTVGVNGIVFDYGSIGTAAVTFTGATNVTASVNDGKAVVSVDGNVISVSGLDAGSYVLTVTTVPDANHVAVEATANVTVNRVDSSISFTNDLAFVYGESDSTNFTVVGATVNETGISVDGHPEAVISLNGNVITVSGLASGKYTLKVTTIPDENHNSVEGVASITVTGIDPALTVSVADIYEGSSAVVAVTTNSAFTGNVTVQIGDANYSVAVTDGKGSVSVSGLAVGTYTATADFKATPVFKESAKNVTFTVNAKIKTSIKAISVITTYGTSKNIVVILSEANGKPIAGKTVTVILNGAKKELTTDGRGQVSYAVGTDLAPKKYTASITFAGDAKYVKSSGSAKVTVNKATAKLTAKNKSFKVKKTKKYTITLKTDKNKALKKGKVTIKVGKVKITKTTNSKGKATFNLKKLSKKGKYKGTVKFAGNKYYKPVSSKIKITIK